VNTEFLWASVGVGALLCGFGAALVLWTRPKHPTNALQSSYTSLPRALTRPRINSQSATAMQHAFGILFLAGGLLLLIVTGLQVCWYSQAATGQGNTSFQAAARESTNGVPFDQVASAFVRNLRTPFGYEIDMVTLTALREEPVCNVSLSSCAPDPASAPVRQWDGTLAWRERRDSGLWRDQSCEAHAILTAARGWQAEGSRWCQLLPKSS
jgi:hypothetical protein